MSQLLENALTYAARGWPVLALRAGQKTPLTTHGLHDATTDPAVIKALWSKCPDANIGVRTGAVSNLVVIDCDVKNDQPGRESFGTLHLPPTTISRTPTGGWHAFYRHPGFEVRNRVGLRPGVDVRADNGYVVAPPSRVNGSEYYWVNEFEAEGLTDLPEHVKKILKASGGNIPVSGQAVSSGERNDYLARLAGSLRGQGLERGAIEAALLKENESRCRPPLENDEVRCIAVSISRYPAPDVGEFPDPAALPDELPPVQKFDLALLPSVCRDWAEDVADRLQCPVDYVAVANMVAFGSLIGRQVAIQPKQHDDWAVVPNLWGAVIGRPGVMKSPALKEALRPVYALEHIERDDHRLAIKDHTRELIEAKNRQRVAEETFRRELRKSSDVQLTEIAAPDAPVRRRYIIHDATVEKLGELLNENPNGLLLYRDELSGFLRNLDKHGREADRSFYLEAWNGDGSFSYDRIGRGTIDIDSATISILGSIQPGPFLKYVRLACANGAMDDGLLQRFQLMVWPDDPGPFVNVDRAPHQAAQAGIREATTRISNLPIHLLTKGAEGAYVSFDSEASKHFQSWREKLENRIRAGEEHPAIESHLAKYRSLIPSLSLIIQLVEDKEILGWVNLSSVMKAIGWSQYLESHARRIYTPGIHSDIDAARLLAKRLLRGDLPNQFSPRDVYRCAWAGLSDPDTVKAAAGVLEDFDWLEARREPTSGRTRLVYKVNPKIRLDKVLTKGS